jgi:hypothetical protein
MKRNEKMDDVEQRASWAALSMFNTIFNNSGGSPCICSKRYGSRIFLYAELVTVLIACFACFDRGLAGMSYRYLLDWARLRSCAGLGPSFILSALVTNSKQYG